MSTLASVIERDVVANRPAAGIAGRLFFASDTGALYRDNGSTWDAVTAGGGSVSSVGLSMPSDFSVSGSPITGSGTFTVTGGVTKSAIQQESYTYAADTGAANAYAVTLSPAPTLVAGSIVVFKAANANTGASTLAVNGGAATAIKKQGSTALASGDIAAGQIIAVVYDGTNFQLVGAGGAGGGGGGGAPTTSKYIIGATDATLTNARVWPKLYNSVDAPPTSAGSLDDEFDGGSLSGIWTWVNQGGAVATVAGSLLSVNAPPAGGDSFRLLLQTAPATPWEVTARIKLTWFFADSAFAGLCLSDASGKFHVFGTGYLSFNQTIIVARYDSVTSWDSNQQTPTAQGLGIWRYLRVRDDGTNLTYSFSDDGVSWLQIQQESRTVFLASGPTKVGLFVDNTHASLSAILACDWFRRTL